MATRKIPIKSEKAKTTQSIISERRWLSHSFASQQKITGAVHKKHQRTVHGAQETQAEFWDKKDGSLSSPQKHLTSIK